MLNNCIRFDLVLDARTYATGVRIY